MYHLYSSFGSEVKYLFLLQIGKLQTNFHRWEQVASNTGEYVHLTKELLTSCESIEWQV
jgi:hypothetical protein